jgi:hypothetical protein
VQFKARVSGFGGNIISWGREMGDSPDIGRAQAATRILLICPDCGHENAEYAQMLQSKSTFYCSGDGCDYIFDLGRRGDFGTGFVELCRRFYAALHLVGRTG